MRVAQGGTESPQLGVDVDHGGYLCFRQGGALLFGLRQVDHAPHRPTISRVLLRALIEELCRSQGSCTEDAFHAAVTGLPLSALLVVAPACARRKHNVWELEAAWEPRLPRRARGWPTPGRHGPSSPAVPLPSHWAPSPTPDGAAAVCSPGSNRPVLLPAPTSKLLGVADRYEAPDRDGVESFAFLEDADPPRSAEDVPGLPGSAPDPETDAHQSAEFSHLRKRGEGSRLGKWAQRTSVGQLKREATEHLSIHDKFDADWNDRTRLPPVVSVDLGGVTLVEAFTPSTVANLYSALKQWPTRAGGSQGDDWKAQLDRGRSTSGGWVNLGLARRPGEWIPGDGLHDSALPASVQAVWLTLHYIVPSVAVVCATFTFGETASDLSSIVKSDFYTVPGTVRVRVGGPFGWLRARIPWARPRDFTLSSQPSDALFGKRRAVQERIQQRNQECAEWFYGRFRGRFANATTNARPAIRLMFTEQAIPFEGRDMWRDGPDLGWSPFVYRSTELAGWSLKDGDWPWSKEAAVTTFAARRSDVGDANAPDGSGQSNWSLTTRFSQQHSKLVALLALRALLGIYERRLAKLRDEAGRNTRIRHPVREARELGNYLVGDGLDAATITADVRRLTDDLTRFRWDVPEYVEELLDGLGKRPTIDFAPALLGMLRSLSSRVAEDTTNTDSNIRASAELRQAVANTRLQRTVVLFSVAALVVALVGLFHWVH